MQILRLKMYLLIYIYIHLYLCPYLIVFLHATPLGFTGSNQV